MSAREIGLFVLRSWCGSFVAAGGCVAGTWRAGRASVEGLVLCGWCECNLIISETAHSRTNIQKIT